MKILSSDLYSITEIVDFGISNFEIRSYQRGYRWDVDNVVALIDDIITSDRNTIYCLQPLVVAPLELGKYEVIDGQQRLTTFKLIYQALKVLIPNNGIGNFYLHYETRSCKSFMDKIDLGVIPTNVDVLNLEVLVKMWNDLRPSLQSEEVSRDNFHLFQSYLTCLHQLKNVDLVDFIDRLKNQVKFIWYEVDLLKLNTSAEKLFANINKNKIKLTGADLIKALFILDIESQNRTNVEAKNYIKQSLANEWDEIEQGLRNPDFWFFLTNSHNQHYDVRIGLLFDIYLKNHSDSDLGSYFIMKHDSGRRNWNMVYDLYKVAFEWFDNLYVYHRIGFLINMNILSFRDILQRYMNSNDSKREFYIGLENAIKTYFAAINFEEISYRKHSGRYGKCMGVLLFYNILLLEKYYPHQRFSFGDFILQDWSLEHIQPQNPTESSARTWKVWLLEIEPIIRDRYDKDTEVIKIDEVQYGIDEVNVKTLIEDLEKWESNKKLSTEITKKIQALQDVFDQEFPTHGIQNLALLDRSTNSRLSNGGFKEKRSIILRLNNEEVRPPKFYLPLGTLHVFTKTMVSDVNTIQLDFWSNSDAMAYELDIKNLLKKYLL